MEWSVERVIRAWGDIREACGAADAGEEGGYWGAC